VASSAQRKPKNPRSCHERALGLLAVRARSRQELERRLLQAGFEAQEVTDVLERLERVGLVDDRAFARQLAEHAFGVKRSGVRAVAGSLPLPGLARDIIAETVIRMPTTRRREPTLWRRAGRMRSLDPQKASLASHPC
jgi:regulatory protein